MISRPAGNMTLPGYEAYSMAYGCIQYEVFAVNIVDGEEYLNGSGVLTDVLRVEGANNFVCPDAPL